MEEFTFKVEYDENEGEWSFNLDNGKQYIPHMFFEELDELFGSYKYPLLKHGDRVKVIIERC